jgi:hypothetical protein
MLINLSADGEILKYLADDDAFLEVLLAKITVCHVIVLTDLHFLLNTGVEPKGAKCR